MTRRTVHYAPTSDLDHNINRYATQMAGQINRMVVAAIGLGAAFGVALSSTLELPDLSVRFLYTAEALLACVLGIEMGRFAKTWIAWRGLVEVRSSASPRK